LWWGVVGVFSLAVVPFGAGSPVPAAAAEGDSSPDVVVEVGRDGVEVPDVLPVGEGAGDGSVVAPVESPPEAIKSALEVLEAAPMGSLQGCASEQPDTAAVPCVRIRPSTSETTPEARPSAREAPAQVLGERNSYTIDSEPPPFGTAAVDNWKPLCTGTGTDGFRVTAVYAYDASLGYPDPAYIQAVGDAIADTDLTFSQSAAKTGGSRRVRFATSSGSSGCAVNLYVAPVSSGLASFDALVDQLVASGWISGNQNAGQKYLIWTEGNLVPSKPSACGIGLSYSDDSPGSMDNANILTSYAAVMPPCWDIDGGGSVPAHELMHTLGAVQSSAPHFDGTGHCTDDHDNMCYGSSTAVVPGCANFAYGEARFDCNDDDYFHTNPAAGSYLCRFWNTARSPHLHGATSAPALSPIPSLWATPSAGRLDIGWSPPGSCPSASFYRVEVAGWGYDVVPASQLSYAVDVPPGNRTITVTPYRDGSWWPGSARSIVASSLEGSPTPEANELPYGGMVLSLNRGRDYGLLAWAIDPETGAPPRMRVTIAGVSSPEYEWNYVWADMPAYTGLAETRSFVYLAKLQPGDYQACFDALDPQGGGWTNLGCTSHSVK
jgi:hypothetical protein